MSTIDDFITLVSLDRKAFEDLKAKVDAFERIKDVARIDIAGISEIQKYNYYSLHKNRCYAVPGFGKARKEKGRRKKFSWTVAEYLAWESIPEEEREAEYERLKAEGQL